MANVIDRLFSGTTREIRPESPFGADLSSLCSHLCQNDVKTEARGVERPLRSWEEHPAEETDEGTRGRLRI